MILKVHPHKIDIVKDEPVNEREINVSKCQFVFDDNMPEDMIKEAYFTLNGETYKQIIINDECDFPHEVLTKKGTVEIGVTPFKLNNNEYEVFYNPSPAYFDTWVGSLKGDYENSEPVTPTDKEQIEQQLLNIRNQMDNLDVEANKVEHTTTITITRKDGTSYDVQVLDGEKGDKGDKGDPGAIKMIIVNELPATGEDDTIYLVPYTIITVEELPQTGLPHTIYIVNNKRYVYESNQWIEISNDNMYVEYIYVNNKWEELGGIGVNVDLSDYYTKQETNALLDGKADTSDIPDLTDYVKNTDYASSSKGGVVKVGRGSNILPDGTIYANVYNYSGYNSADNSFFISKGTLENVITGKQLVNQTYVDNAISNAITNALGGSY